MGKDYSVDDLIGFAVETIRLAGEEALSFYGRGDPSIRFDETLVTKTDLHVSGFFHKRLLTDFPEHQSFRGNRQKENYTHDESRYLWIFDPLDGVANFQAGIPTWGMSLALFENFWPVLGVFFMPATGDLFYASAGENAYWGENRIEVSRQKNLDDESLLFTYSRFNRHYRTEFPGKIRDLGCTAAHLCYVAAGKAEAALIANESYQDLAAACVIVEAAGGKIIKMNGDKFFLSDYLEGKTIEDHLLVTSPGVSKQVINCLHRI